MTGALFGLMFLLRKRKDKKKLRTLYSTYLTMSFGIFENITDLKQI